MFVDSARDLVEAMKESVDLAAAEAREATCRQEQNFGEWLTVGTGIGSLAGGVTGAQVGLQIGASHSAGAWALRVGSAAEGFWGGGVQGVIAGGAVAAGVTVMLFGVYSALPICG
jgi:uncharacterized protein YcfJ